MLAGNALKRTALVSAVGLALAFAGGTAQAAPITVGQSDFTPNSECNALIGSYTLIQSSVASGNSYKVPVNGVITSWSFHAGSAILPGVTLKVVRLGSMPNHFTVVGESKAGAQTATQVSSFPVSIPVKANDMIGIIPGSSGTCASYPTFGADGLLTYGGNPTTGTEVEYGSSPEFRIPVSVSVQPPPTVASLSPAAGDVAGGTKVTITGEDFTGATAVSFGPAPAAAFSVNGDTQITAFSPAGAVGAVDVRVTTAAGQSAVVSGNQFTFAVTAGPPAPTTTAPTSAPTGKRAAALKKCKSKHGKAKKRCKKRAKKLPV